MHASFVVVGVFEVPKLSPRSWLVLISAILSAKNIKKLRKNPSNTQCYLLCSHYYKYFANLLKNMLRWNIFPLVSDDVMHDNDNDYTYLTY